MIFFLNLTDQTFSCPNFEPDTSLIK